MQVDLYWYVSMFVRSLFLSAQISRAQLTVSLPVHTSTPAKPVREAVHTDNQDRDSHTDEVANAIEGAQDNLEDTIEAEVEVEPEGMEPDKIGGGDINNDQTADHLEYRSIADPPARPETEGMDSSELCRPSDSMIAEPGSTRFGDSSGPSLTTISSGGSSSSATSANVGATSSTSTNVAASASTTDTPGAPKSDLENLLSWQPSQR